MVYRSLLLGALLAWSTASSAQSPVCTWVAARPLDLSTSIFTQSPQYQLAAGADGGVWTMGMSTWVRNYSSYSYGTLHVAHATADGTIDHQLDWTGPALGYQMGHAPDGALFVAGEFLDSLVVDAEHALHTDDTFPHSFLVKLDAEGNTVWARDLNTSLGTVRMPRGLAFDAAGNMYLGVDTDDGTRIVKYDAQGDVVMTIEQNAPTLFCIDVDVLGYIYVTGSCAPPQNAMFGGVAFQPNVSGNGYNRYLVRYTPAGVPTWVKFSGDVTCSTSEVRSFGAEGVYWVGHLVGEAEFDGHQLNGPVNGGTPDMHLCRLDSAGNYAWAIEGPTAQSSGIGPGIQHYIELDGDGNLILAGSGKGTLDWGSTVVVSNGLSDVLLTCYGPTGELLWAEQGVCAGQADQAHGVARSPDGALYVIGLIRQNITFGTQTLTAPSATNYPFVARFASDIGTGAPTVDQGPEVTLHPVPVDDILQVRTTVPIAQAACIDAMGRRSAVPMEHGTMDLQALAPGGYALELVLSDGQRVVRRFVKR